MGGAVYGCNSMWNIADALPTKQMSLLNSLPAGSSLNTKSGGKHTSCCTRFWFIPPQANASREDNGMQISGIYTRFLPYSMRQYGYGVDASSICRLQGYQGWIGGGVRSQITSGSACVWHHRTAEIKTENSQQHVWLVVLLCVMRWSGLVPGFIAVTSFPRWKQEGVKKGGTGDIHGISPITPPPPLLPPPPPPLADHMAKVFFIDRGVLDKAG